MIYATTCGKCWIYKRATVHVNGAQPYILDYSNGIEPFDCNSVYHTDTGLQYLWSLPNSLVEIPLNVSRTQTNSIIRTGVIPIKDGEIRWEFIYGKFVPYDVYRWTKVKEYMPMIFLIILLVAYIASIKYRK